MNPAHLNQTWGRWLDKRSIDDQMLGDVMETDPFIREDLVEDLAVHRQIDSLARVASSNDVFLAEMLIQYDELDLEAAESSTGSRAQSPTAESGADGLKVQVRTDGRASSGTVSRSGPKRLGEWSMLALVFAGISVGLLAYVLKGSNRPSPLKPSNAAAVTKKDKASTDSKEGPSLSSQSDNKAGETEGGSREETWVPETFATVKSIEPCEWRFAPPEDGRIATMFLALGSGKAEIAFDDGTRVLMTGPARINVVNQQVIGIFDGEFEFDGTKTGDKQWTIDTPNAEFDVDGGSRFTYELEKSGRSRLALDQGQLKVQPWDELNQDQEVVLSPGDLDGFEVVGAQPAIAKFSSSKDVDDIRTFLNIQGKVLDSRNMTMDKGRLSAGDGGNNQGSDQKADRIADRKAVEQMLDQMMERARRQDAFANEDRDPFGAARGDGRSFKIHIEGSNREEFERTKRRILEQMGEQFGPGANFEVIPMGPSQIRRSEERGRVRSRGE